MTDLEKICAFIERVKGKHTRFGQWDCNSCGGDFPCDALRAVLALEEIPGILEAVESEAGFLRRFLGKLEHRETIGKWGAVVNSYAAVEIPEWELRQRLDDVEDALKALARAAQKIGGEE